MLSMIRLSRPLKREFISSGGHTNKEDWGLSIHAQTLKLYKNKETYDVIGFRVIVI